jgi:virulence-associated protein VagC
LVYTTSVFYKGLIMIANSVSLNNKTQTVRLPMNVRLGNSVKKVFIRKNNKR